MVLFTHGLNNTVDDLLLAASAGDSQSQFLLGFHFYNDKSDIYSAIHWYKEAIKQNNHNAMYALAAIYFTNSAPIKNLGLALKYMISAADHGNPKALFFMALGHLNGDHVPLNHEHAIKYLERAVLKRHTQAIYTLAQFYESGQLVKTDKVKACALYRIAKEAGHKLAEARCTYLMFSMSKEEIDQSTAYTEIDHMMSANLHDAA